MFKLFIAGLKEGISHQERTVRPAELNLAEDGEFQHDVTVRLEIDKVARNIFVVADLDTNLALVCDRCAEPFEEPLAEKYRMLFTTDTDMANDEDESTFLIHDTVDEVDLTEPLRETMMLALPFKRLCRSECLGLCDRCGANLNVTKCQCKTNPIDPRWDKLKSLLD